MTTRHLRRMLGALLGTALLGAAAVGTAAPASAAPAGSYSAQVDYVALGDSYAAGQGVLPYSDPACKRSKLSYPVLIDVVPRVRLTVDAACTGARTSTIPAQLAQTGTDALRQAEVITLTVGANDLDPSAVYAACLPGAPAGGCATAVGAALARIPAAAAGLGADLALIAAATPGAKIVVTGYPLLFNEAALTGGQLTLGQGVNAAIRELNAAIQRVVLAAQPEANVVYVDVVRVFAGHEIGSRFPWIIGPGTGATPNPDAFHPNAFGQAAYAVAVARAAV